MRIYILMQKHKYPGHRLEDNIKMAVEEVGCEGVNWIYLA